jgi:hypothetical protein
LHGRRQRGTLDSRCGGNSEHLPRTLAAPAHRAPALATFHVPTQQRFRSPTAAYATRSVANIRVWRGNPFAQRTFAFGHFGGLHTHVHARLQAPRFSAFFATRHHRVRGNAVLWRRGARAFALLPIEPIARELRVNASQRAALLDLQHAVAQAGDMLKRQCPAGRQVVSPESLDQIERELRAALHATEVIAPALGAFYALLPNRVEGALRSYCRQQPMR